MKNNCYLAGAAFLWLLGAAVGAQAQTTRVYDHPLPPPNAFFDFGMTGEKGYIFLESDYISDFHGIKFFSGISSDFAEIPDKKINFGYDLTNAVVPGIDYVNADSEPDIALFSSQQFSGNNQYTLLSDGKGGYGLRKNLLFYGNWDVNADGRTELAEQLSGYTVIHRLMPDGSMLAEQMDVRAFSEYQGEFDAASWMDTQQAAAVGKRPGGNPWAILTGAALEPSTDPSPFTVPDRTLDLNADGYVDLIESSTGTIYYGTPEGCYVISTVGGAVVVKDLNGDGIADYVVSGGENGVVKTLVYRGGGEFEERQLIDNLAADEPVWCYDFDKDGDVDILVTFSAMNTDGQTCYTLFFENDGTGNFTQREDYQEHLWKYSTCRDIDADGCYDLLLIDYEEAASAASGDAEFKVMVRRGGSDFSFGEAEELYTFSYDAYSALRPDNTELAEIRNWTVEAEDLDGDGRTEIWVSHNYVYAGNPAILPGRTLYRVETGAVNTAPVRPAAPGIDYNASLGELKITWREASDAQCGGKDLTYAVRIGSAPGKDDMLKGFALADGTRLNFSDGNAGSSLEKRLDVRSWKSGTYYVSLQAVDPNHAGSAWSEEVSFDHAYVPADFTVASATVSTADVVDVYYTDDSRFTRTWNVGDGRILSDATGVMRVQWPAPGDKKLSLTLTAADGSAATSEQTVSVMANRFGRTDGSIFHQKYELSFFDYDGDGKTDYADTDGLYRNEGDGVFSKAKGIYNQGLDIERSRWVDWNMDGRADLVYDGRNMSGAGSYEIAGILQSNGSGSFSKISDPGFTVVNESGYEYNDYVSCGYMLDLNNDGFPEVVSGNGSFYENSGNRTFTFRNDLYKQGFSGFFSEGEMIDWDGDGLWDQYRLERDGYGYDKLTVYHNLGNLKFEKLQIPFDQPIAKEELEHCVLVDFDSDGYCDILGFKDEHTMTVLRNEENGRFVPDYEITLGHEVTLTSKANYGGVYSEYTLFDLDNNGYEDIFITAYDKSRQDSLSVYAVYVEAPGKYRQGFIAPGGTPGKLIAKTLETGKAPAVYAGGTSESAVAANLTNVVNTRPQAPSMVTAVQTENSLLIEWNPATDKETPSTKLRYNLSVRKKGATGEGSYVISPLNGLINAAGPLDLSDYAYHRATRFDIPVEALPVGELEVQVQAIDLWGETSDFSAPVTVKVENAPMLAAPTSVCFGSVATVEYKGTRPQGVTPVWDFGGGDVLEGEGYGPYSVVWDTDGVKKVSVSVDGAVSEVNVAVQPDYSAAFSMPEKVFFNAGFEITLPEVPRNAAFSWSLSGETVPGKDMEVDAVPGKMTAVARVVGHPELSERTLTLTVHQNGCSKEHQVRFTVMPELEPPVLSLVESEGVKNAVTWNPSWIDAGCSEIVVYKEGSYLNEFREIGRAGKSEGRFLDVAANNTVRSERYAIAMQMQGGEVSPMSGIHQTVLLTINRGMAENQFNLIWNGYQGRDIATYRILRGASPESLREIASMPGSVTSYTDMAVEAEPYYALEFTPVEEYYPGIRTPLRTAQSEPAVRTNVVFSGDARDIVYADRLQVLSVGGATQLTEEMPVIYLYAEVFPATATYQQVAWSVEEGEQLVSVDSYGTVVGKGNGNGGEAVIRATALDGSGATATFRLTVGGFSGAEKVGLPESGTVRIYPQPAREQISVRLDAEIKRMVLIDLNGAAVAVSGEGETTLDMSALPAGIYLLRIETADGIFLAEKVVKE